MYRSLSGSSVGVVWMLFSDTILEVFSGWTGVLWLAIATLTGPWDMAMLSRKGDGRLRQQKGDEIMRRRSREDKDFGLRRRRVDWSLPHWTQRGLFTAWSSDLAKVRNDFEI